MEGMDHQEKPTPTPRMEYCPCSLKDTKPSDQPVPQTGLHECNTCRMPISEVRMEQVKKMLKPSS